MSQSLRIGIIGAGGIAKSRHLPNLSQIPDVEVVAVCNRREETARAVADEWGIPKVVDRWERIVEDPEIDVVFVCTPPYLHKEISIAALSAGKHTFCQARMAMNYAEARAMAEVARSVQSKGIKAQICLAPLGLPIDGAMRHLLVHEEVLGTFTHGIAVLGDRGYLDPTAPLHWRQIGHISGLNTLTLGLFVEALHRWMGTFRRVQAFTHTVTHHRPSDQEGRLAPVDRPDIVSITAEHHSGGIMTLLFSGVTRTKEQYVELHGTKGSIRHVIGEPSLWVNRGSSWECCEIPKDELTQWSAERDFIHSIRTNEPILYPNPSFEDGLKYMELTEAVFRSADQGRTIRMPFDAEAQ